MIRTLYHLHFLDTGRDAYYGSIKSLVSHNSHDLLGVGRDTLYRFDWSKKYENQKINIQKGVLHTTHTIKQKTVAA